MARQYSLKEGAAVIGIIAKEIEKRRKRLAREYADAVLAQAIRNASGRLIPQAPNGCGDQAEGSGQTDVGYKHRMTYS